MSSASTPLGSLKRTGRRLQRLVRDPNRTLHDYFGRRVRAAAGGAAHHGSSPSASPTTSSPSPSPSASAWSATALTPREALERNGFYIFRELIPERECFWMSKVFKSDANITDGEKSTNLDAFNRFPSTRPVLFDRRILGAVRAAVGTDPCFLQVGDLHYYADTAVWHRDSTARAADSSTSPDWRSSGAPYRVVKAIVYLETDAAGMGIMVGSHRSPVAIDKQAMARREKAGHYTVVGRDQGDPNREFTPAEMGDPVIWSAAVGDVLVFDERLYHCGRRVQGPEVTNEKPGRKFTLSMVFGGDDDHSARMYSYFRYARTELGYGELEPRFARTLARRGLVMSAGWANRFVEHPDELDSLHFANEGQAEILKRRFAGQPAS